MILHQTQRGTALFGAQQAVPALPQLVPAQYDPLNRMASYLGLAVVFLQFSVLPQIEAYVLHVNLYLMYLFGVPALVSLLLSGGIRKSFRGRPTYYWTGFGCWMLLATPFSSWPGGSAVACFDYWRTSLAVMFILAGAISNWTDVKNAMNVIACAGIVNLLCSRLFREDMGQRMALSLGSISDPNDYAAHLLLVLPFLLWVLLTGKSLFRVISLACIGFGMYVIIGTGSRGAIVALAVDVVFVFARGSGRQKAALALIGPVAAAILVALAPSTFSQRVATIWSNSADSTDAQTALASTAAREYTLKTSIRYTFEHPLFGVGPDQFASYEGGRERVIGTHGYWHNTHNSFTQAASECGIPGLLLFAAGILSTLLLFNKTFCEARRRPNCQDIRTGVFCMMLGMLGFTVAITFLSFAYFFYLPAMGGLAIGVWSAAQHEFETRDAALQAHPA